LKGGDIININRTERHIIKKSHKMWKMCDELCFKSKNLYNYANYIQRQRFINNENIIKYNELSQLLNKHETFTSLGSNSAQHTLKMLDKTWKSFFVAIKDYWKNPSRYLGKPNIPKYKDKNGRYVCVLTNLQSQIKDGYLYFAFKPLQPFNNIFRTKIKGKHMQTRIIPKGSCYVLEVVYETEVPEVLKESKNIVGIDLGLNNFATLTNNVSALPIIINGKIIKSYNQYWNKRKSNLSSDLKKRHNQNWSNKLETLTQKRNNKMEYFMHCASKCVIDYCIGIGCDTIVIGYNEKWKQNSKMSRKVNQEFIQLPYENFINKLRYKCENQGIILIDTEESYTSGTSFLDNELPIKENYIKKRRIHRGLFKSNGDILINADVNGAYQIIKKVFPKAFADEIVGVDLHPIRVNVG
jgi:putative transposase